MISITFRVPAVPIAQPRARATMRAGHASVYTPTKHPVSAFKATVRHAAAEAYDGAPLQGPLHLSAVFVFPRPGRLIWKKRPMPRLRHSCKPDRDNLDKALLDSLKGLIWADDCQVCDGSIEKWYAAGDEQPHVEVRIVELSEEQS